MRINKLGVRRGGAIVGLSLAALALAGCAVTDETGVVHAGGVEQTVGEHSGLVSTGGSPARRAGHVRASVGGVNLVNTSSVLFPLHDLHEGALETKMEAYISHFKTIPVQNITVTKSTHTRKGPGSLQEALEIVSKGTVVEVDGRLAGWYRLADGSGYISAIDVAEPDLPEGVVMAMTVVNKGDSEMISACEGGLTEYDAMTKDLGVPVWVMHSYCGGEPLMERTVGEMVTVDGVRYHIDSINKYPLFGSTENMVDVDIRDAFLQVCDLTHGQTWVIGLAADHTVPPPS